MKRVRDSETSKARAKDVKHMHGTNDVAGLCETGLLRRGRLRPQEHPSEASPRQRDEQSEGKRV